MLHVYSVVLATTLTVLAAAGCGSSTKTGQTSTVAATSATTQQSTVTSSAVPVATGPALSRATFLTRADAICRRTNVKRGNVHITNSRNFVLYMPRLTEYQQAAVADLSKLVPPPSLASDWQAMLSAEQRIAAAYAKATTLVRSGEFGPARAALVAAVGSQSQLSSIGSRDGFHDCLKLQ